MIVALKGQFWRLMRNDEIYEMIIPIVLTVFHIFGVLGRPEIYTQPEQVHLSYGYRENEMVITWVTLDDAKGTIVEYGSHKVGILTNVVKGASTVFRDDGLERRELHIHRATLKDLIPGEEYIYHVGSDVGGWSDVFTFRTMKNGTDWSPTLVFMGDMGNVNGKSTPALQREVQKRKFDAIFHIGDFAYDFNDDNARVGDAYMNQIQSFAAYVPYMTVVGNHEMAYNFSNYKNRFTMPGGDGNGMFYSMNIGPIHLIAFSSEFYYFTQYGWRQIIEQFKWLERDLKEANKPENRAKQPWIITMCHRPLYCSNSNDPEHCGNMENMIRVGIPGSHEYNIEDLLYKYGVDIHFQAHEHSYERTWPVYNLTVCNGTFWNPYRNPRAPIHIVTGSGGCKEGVDPFVKAPAPWSAFHSDDYGYTIMKVANKTHLLLNQISVDQGGSVIDSITVEKDRHGMGSYDCHKFHEFQVKQDLFKKIFTKL